MIATRSVSAATGRNTPSRRTNTWLRGNRSNDTPASPSSGALAGIGATLFLGAGVFSLPNEAATIGLIPLLLMLAVVWLGCVWLYRRVAELLARPQHHDCTGGGEALGRAVVAAGAGHAGTLLAWCGVLVYVVCAAIAYTTLGLVGLEALARQIPQSPGGWYGLAAVFAAALGLERSLPARSTVARRLARLGMVWSVGVAAMALLNGVASRAWTANGGHGSWPTIVIALFTFAAGSVVVSRTASAAERAEQAPGGLDPEHRTPLVALGVQGTLMVAMIGLGLLSALHSGRHPAFSVGLWPTQGFKVSDLLGPLGVVLFALCATGLINVARYPRMAEARFRRAVVDRSLGIVGAVQALWMIAVVLLAGHTGMAAERSAGTNSAMGLASTVAAPGSVTGTLLVVLGALATLIAVTNANVGFNSSLASESLSAIGALRPQMKRRLSERKLLIALILLALAGAGCNLASRNAVAAFLTIGGITGGGVIVIVLPLLAENRDRYRVRYGAAASLAAVALGSWATLTAVLDEHLSVPLMLMAILVAWATVALTCLAARRVMKAADSKAFEQLSLWDELRRVSNADVAASRQPTPVDAPSVTRGVDAALGIAAADSGQCR